MKLENFINYYFALKALRFLLERGLLSETEYEQVCRYNAEIFKPGRSARLYGLLPRIPVKFVVGDEPVGTGTGHSTLST